MEPSEPERGDEEVWVGLARLGLGKVVKNLS